MNRSTWILVFVFLASVSAHSYAAGGANHIPGLFLGFTDTGSAEDFTIGLEYEYKFDSGWGVGAVYERIDDGSNGDGIDIFLGSVYYHPGSNIRLGLGAGREEIGGNKNKSKDLVRVSAAYDFHFDRFGIAPTIAVDFIEGDQAYVFGVAFVRPF
jgi:hypothetical protein